MLLHTKLVTGMMGGLAMTLLLGGVALLGLKETDEQVAQMTDVSQGSLDTLAARVSQLRYLYYGDETEVARERDTAARAAALFEQAARREQDPTQRERLQQLGENLHQYTRHFERLVEATAALSAVDTQINEATREIYSEFATLLAALRAELKTAADESRIAAYGVLSEGLAGFNLTRMAMWKYRAMPPGMGKPDETQAAVTRTHELLDQAEQLLGNGTSAARFKAAKDQLDSYMTLFQQAIALRVTQEDIVHDMQGLVAAITTEAGTAAAWSGRQLAEGEATVRWRMAVLTVFTLALGLLMVVLLPRSIHRQLGKDPGVLADIARRVSNGDFAVDDGSPARGVYADLLRMAASLKDHIATAHREAERARAESARAVQALEETERAQTRADASRHEGILEAANRLENIANVVSTLAGRLAGQVGTAEAGALTQAERMAEVATAMEQMNAAMVEVARNAGGASQASQTMRQRSEEGVGIMRDTVAGIQAAREQAASMKQSMTTLVESVQAINQIMAVISDIADQTNLLALNAAIEAARAGEAGRGFAVVADEVRKLAEKTMTSTTDVARVIRHIRTSAAENMRQVDMAVTEIEKSSTLVGSSGVVLTEIEGMVENTSDQVRAIAIASEQQSAASESINRAMSQVNAIAEDMAATMRLSGGSVEELGQQVRALMGLIGSMQRS